MEIIFALIIIAMPFALIFLLVKFFVLKKNNQQLHKNLQTEKNNHKACQKTLEPLKQYSIMQSAEEEVEKILKTANEIEQAAQQDATLTKLEANKAAYNTVEAAKLELKTSKEKSKQLREKAEIVLQEAHALATKIEETAQQKARQVAGESWNAREQATQYEATTKAMKNIINGYGDQYLIPNHSVLDDLALEFDHKQAGQDLANTRKLIKSMIQNGQTTDCGYVAGHRHNMVKNFVLDAYNGKVDAIMIKARHNNYGTLQQQLNDAYHLVNHSGKAFKNAHIIPRYHEVILKQLKQTVTLNEIKRIDREEQKEIKAQMREEARAAREYTKAQKTAEREEKLIQKALAEARKKLDTASDQQKAQFEQKLLELQGKLTEAEQKNQRALSMAQQTRKGHVYVISNIGSFGKNIYKIGMTRRLEPLDRVKELGGASVPFSFDVHAMIQSDDAPKLEKALHHKFADKQVNKINPRKEFFALELSQIRQVIEAENIETHWTMQAEASQYRESLAMKV